MTLREADEPVVIGLPEDTVVVPRWEWMARSSQYDLEPLEHPVKHVRLVHTGTFNCDDPLSCGRLVRALQHHHMAYYNFPDIAYNFLIDRSGIIYEGRGWDHQASRPEEFGYLQDKCLDIAFIGDYGVTTDAEKPTSESVRSAVALIRGGSRAGLIDGENGTLLPLGILAKIYRTEELETETTEHET